jgi:hypothetical protein
MSIGPERFPENLSGPSLIQSKGTALLLLAQSLSHFAPLHPHGLIIISV